MESRVVVADIVHEYATSAQNNFGRTETTRRPSVLARFRVLRGLEKDAPEAADAIRKLEPTEFTPITDCLMSPVAVSVARAGGADGLDPVGTCIAAMFKILKFSTNAKKKYNREERILMSIDCTTNLGEALRDRRGRMGIPDPAPIARDDMAELLKFA